MKLYLDICCLKRPFDDQTQPRVRMETEAVLSLLGEGSSRLTFVRSVAHDLENDQNPLPWRAERACAELAGAEIFVTCDDRLLAVAGRLGPTIKVGWVNAVRFLREYETGGGDYVREREAILPDWDAETLVRRALRQG